MRSHRFSIRDIAATGLLLALAPACARPLPPAEELMARADSAMGRSAGPGAVRHGHLGYETRSNRHAGVMRTEQYWAAPDRMLVRITMPGVETLAGRKGDVFWIIDPQGGPRLISAEELEIERDFASLGGHAVMTTGFRSMETVERTEMQGVPCYRVKMTEGGLQAEHCVAVDGGLLVWSLLSVQNASRIATRFLEYRDFGGIKLPAHIVGGPPGGEQIATRLTVADNAPQPDSIFAIPAEIQALLDARGNP